MTLSLKESRAITDMANILYDFLPGSGNPNWKGHVSFKTVAQEVEVGDFWQPGSKLPMIINLLKRTYQERPSRFERLVLEVVNASITYRQKQNRPISPSEIDQLNGHILELGFKFPDLWDPEFRNSLEIESGHRAKQQIEQALQEERIRVDMRSERSSHLADLKKQFFELHGQPNRQAAGLALQSILNRLFALEGLAPSAPFRVTGEEIDGSFELDHETYLVEAKWENEPLPEASLLTFKGKIEGKSAFTRGVFIALNGISKQAKEAICYGKQPIFYIIDGYDLTMILSENISLKDFLRQRQRLLAERGLMVVPYAELWPITYKKAAAG